MGHWRNWQRRRLLISWLKVRVLHDPLGRNLVIGGMIPKIIHQTAPSKVEDWHPVWEECHKSWKIQFPTSEYLHILWNDEDLDNLVENCFPEYWLLYQSFTQHIIKIDFARFCMLYKHGGIYVDMDFYCYKNFYNLLEDGVYLLESQNPKSEIEAVQNCLMISNQGNEFFKECMNFCKIIVDKDSNIEVLKTCGPWFLTKMYNKFSKMLKTLPYTHYNPPLNMFHEGFITRHMLTGLWGKETISSQKILMQQQEQNNFKEFLQKTYAKFRGIEYDENFDYSKDYSNKNY